MDIQLSQNVFQKHRHKERHIDQNSRRKIDRPSQNFIQKHRRKDIQISQNSSRKIDNQTDGKSRNLASVSSRKIDRQSLARISKTYTKYVQFQKYTYLLDSGLSYPKHTIQVATTSAHFVLAALPVTLKTKRPLKNVDVVLEDTKRQIVSEGA